MAFVTEPEVRMIVDTNMANASITDLITGIQALQILVLTGGGPNATVRKEICRLWTAIRVMLKDPEAAGLGEYSENRTYALKKLNEHLRNMIRIAGGGIAFKAHISPI